MIDGLRYAKIITYFRLAIRNAATIMAEALSYHITRNSMGNMTASRLLFTGMLLTTCILDTPRASATEVAILQSAEVSYYTDAVQAFRSSLPPHTQVAEFHLSGDLARGREIAKSLRGDPPDLVMAVGLKAALAAKLELVDTPTLFCLVLDPEAHGLPGPNMTGISMRVSPDAQLDSIRTMAPRAKRIGILYDPEHTGPIVTEARRAAKKLDIEIIAVAVADASTVPNALRTLLPKIDLFWLLQDQTIVTQDSLEFILKTTLESKVPVFGFSPTLVQQGALGALVVNARDIGQQAGMLASSMLRNKISPQQALQHPARVQLAINLNTAEYVGLNPSKAVLRLATLLYGGPGPVAKTEDALPLIP